MKVERLNWYNDSHGNDDLSFGSESSANTQNETTCAHAYGETQTLAVPPSSSTQLFVVASLRRARVFFLSLASSHK